MIFGQAPTDMNPAWYRYEIDLGRPVRLGPRETRARSGYILRIQGEGDLLAAGEAAPIDGYGSDTVSDVQAVLADAADACSSGFIPSGVDELATWSCEHAKSWPATVRFAAETALAFLAARSAGGSLGEWLGGVRRPVIEVCGLTAAGDGDAPAAPGPGTVLKVKVGRGDPSEEGSMVASLVSNAGGRVRCDANRAWSPEQADRFMRAFLDTGGAPDRFEFLEEPLIDTADLSAFAAESPVPLALDETVLEAGPDFDPDAWSGIDLFVLKPSLFGGLTDAMQFTERVHLAGGSTIVSSAFESGLGLAAVAWFAAAVDGPAVGLGTAHFVACDDIPVSDALLARPIASAHLPVHPADSINFAALEEIDD